MCVCAYIYIYIYIFRSVFLKRVEDSLPQRSCHKKDYTMTRKNHIKNDKQYSIIFNKTCFHNNLLLKCTFFNIYIYIYIYIYIFR